jgi:hypothetical protein
MGLALLHKQTQSQQGFQVSEFLEKSVSMVLLGSSNPESLVPLGLIHATTPMKTLKTICYLDCKLSV